MPRKRLLWASAATTVVALTAGGAFFVREAYRRADDPYQQALDAKIADAELTLAYGITPTHSVTFRLFPTDTEIKVASHVNVPIDNPHDNKREYVYGVRFEVLNADHDVIWNSVYWEKTNATKIQAENALVPWEPAFYRDRQDVMPTDNRLTTFFAAPLFAAATDKKTTPKYLRVSLGDSNYESGVCRAFRKVERPPEQRPTAWQTIGRKTRYALTEHSVYSDDMLTDPEREALVAFKWERLFAAGRKGRDYFLRPVYLARMNPPLEENPSDDLIRFLVSEDRFVAANIRGVGTLRIEVTFPDEVGVPPRKGANIEVERLDEDAGMWWGTKWVVPKPTFETEKQGLDPVAYYDVTVPPGLHTFVFRSDVPAAIRLNVDDPKMFVEGANGVEFLAVSGRWVDLEPHTFGATFYRSLGPRDMPIDADVSYNARFGSAVRIVSRMRLDTKDTAPKRYSVFYDILDVAGNVVTSGRYDATASQTPFDYYEAEALNPHVAPSSAETYQLPIPSNARTLRIRTSDVAEVAFYAQDTLKAVTYKVPTKFERTRDLIYIDCENPPDKEWRYFRPENYEELDRKNRSVGVRWFCRALRRKSDDSNRRIRLYDAEPVVRLIKPDTLVETTDILERYRPTDEPEAVTDLTFFETPVGKPFRVRIADTDNPHHRLPVAFEVVRDRPSDRPVRMSLDGSPFQPVVSAITKGRQAFDEVPQGIRTVRFDDDTGARLFVNREPEAATKAIWKRRTSYVLSRTTPVYVTVPKSGIAAQTLNVAVYAKDASPRLLTAQIANPPPIVPGTEFAWQTRTFQLDAWEPFEGFDTHTGERYTKRLTVFVSFNEAFPPRDYHLRLSLTGGSDVVARFLVVGDEPFVVTPTRDAALNLIGPGNLWVRWDGASRGSALTCTRWNSAGEVVSERVPFVTRTIFPEARITVPSGLHTYFLNVQGVPSAGLFFYVDDPADMMLGRTAFSAIALRKPLLRTRVEPDTYVTRYYVTGSGVAAPAEFAIPAPSRYLRVDVRRIGTASTASSDTTNILYDLTDATGRKVSSGAVSIVLQPSTTTDSIAPQPSKEPISGASYGYIRVPPDAARIALRVADPRIALTLDAQTPDYVSDTYLPEDTTATNRVVNVIDSAHTSQWMSLTPANHDTFFFEGRIVDVVAQKVAVKPEPYVPVDPVRFWTAFAPVGAFTPDLEVMEPLDPQADNDTATAQTIPVANVFEANWRELPTNAPIPFRLRGLPGFRLTERDVPIAYVHDGKTPVRMTVLVDDAFHASFEMTSANGTTTLAGVPLGAHRVECRVEPRTPSFRVFAFVAENDIESTNDTTWSKRGYYQLKARDSLAITVSKPSTAPYSVNVAGYVAAQPSERRLALRVRIEPERLSTPLTGITNTERVFYVNAQSDRRQTVVPLTGGVPELESLSNPFRFTLPLKEDIGVGRVRIVLSWEEDATGYFRFFGSDEDNNTYEPGRVAVLNAVGPGSFWIAASDGVVGDKLRTVVLTPDGLTVASDLYLPKPDANGVASVTVPLPTDCVTVRVENASSRPMRLRFFVESDETVARAEVRPRYQTQTFYASYPTSPVTLVIPSEMREEQTLRVTVRKPLSRNGSPEMTHIRYRLLDSDGREISSGDYALFLTPSRASSLYAGMRYACMRSAVSPSETGQFYVEATSSVVAVELVSDTLAMFRLHRRLGSVVRETVVPDDYERTEGVRVRPRIITTSEWEPIEPTDNAMLARDGRVMSVDEPVALVVASDDSSALLAQPVEPAAIAEVLEPVDAGDTVFVMEPSLPDVGKELTVNAVTYFRIRPNADTPLTVVAATAPTAMIPTDIRIFYRLPTVATTDGVLGATPCSLRISLDGREVVELPLMTPQGFVTVPGVMPGRHRLRASVDARNKALCDGIELFINQTPSPNENATPWKLRSVHTLTADEPSVLTVEKRDREELSLNVVVYPEPDMSSETPVLISVTIDDGIRRGNVADATEDFTNFRRLYRLPNTLSTAFYLNRRNETPGMAQTFFVPLQNDLISGSHRVQIRIESGTKRARARFFIMRNGEVADTIEFRQSESEDART